MDELGEPAAGCDHPEGGVAGAYQLAGRLDNAAQHGVEGEAAYDQLVGAQQTPQPTLGAYHLLGTLDELTEQLVELQPGQIGKGQPRVFAWLAAAPGRRRVVVLGGGFRCADAVIVGHPSSYHGNHGFHPAPRRKPLPALKLAAVLRPALGDDSDRSPRYGTGCRRRV